MQISRIYCNKPEVFSPINFNCATEADRLNVVLGEVRHPKDQRKDSHNLGKTTLIHLIDFLLLKGMSPDQFLFKNRHRFEHFVFFIEIALNTGKFATVRRSAADPNKIAMTRHEDRGQDFTNTANDEWDHYDLPRDTAVSLLDGWLDLRILKPYDYRQAITYFLRTQADYSDELQLQKFSSGKDVYWKPFVAHLFGFPEAPIQRKYELDDQIERLKERKAEQQISVQFSEDQLSELVARIAVLERQLDEAETALDSFNFEAQERRLLVELVDKVERDISEINDQLYNIRYDMSQIDAALSHEDKFDLKEVSEIFSEAGVHFPAALKKSYDDLVTFNRKVTRERNAALRARRKSLVLQQQQLEASKSELDHQRSMQLRVLRDTDSFEKFKSLQKELTSQRANLVYLDEQRKRLEELAETARKMREAERERGRIVDEIKAMVAKPTIVFQRFSATFNYYCQRVLNHDGIFFFTVNSNNNFDYQIGLSLPGGIGTTSSLSDGTSYKKLLCALFDLALLKVYEDAPFFHFVYHDGIFEALDDRKKLALLEVIREQISRKKTQYILTLIDSDHPRDAEGQRILFDDDEIVVRLHDDGDRGRLFKMPEF